MKNIYIILGLVLIIVFIPIIGGQHWEYLAIGIASLVLSVVVMKIRKNLE